jgi:hypothetical protein
LAEDTENFIWIPSIEPRRYGVALLRDDPLLIRACETLGMTRHMLRRSCALRPQVRLGLRAVSVVIWVHERTVVLHQTQQIAQTATLHVAIGRSQSAHPSQARSTTQRTATVTEPWRGFIRA